MTKIELVKALLDDAESNMALAAEIRFGSHAFDTHFNHVPEQDLLDWYREWQADLKETN